MPTDNLRTRIAVTLWNFARPKALTIEEAPLPDVFLGMADAVIRELGLQERWRAAKAKAA